MVLPAKKRTDWDLDLDQIAKGVKILKQEHSFCDPYHPGEWYIDLKQGSCGVFISFHGWDALDAFGRLYNVEWPYQCNREITGPEMHGIFWEVREYIQYRVHDRNTEGVVLTVHPQKTL